MREVDQQHRAHPQPAGLRDDEVGWGGRRHRPGQDGIGSVESTRLPAMFRLSRDRTW